MKKNAVHDSSSDDLDVGVYRDGPYSNSMSKESEQEEYYRDVINEWCEQYAPQIIERFLQDRSCAPAKCTKDASGGKAKLVKTNWFYNPKDINNLKETRK